MSDQPKFVAGKVGRPNIKGSNKVIQFYGSVRLDEIIIGFCQSTGGGKSEFYRAAVIKHMKDLGIFPEDNYEELGRMAKKARRSDVPGEIDPGSWTNDQGDSGVSDSH